MSLMKVLFTGIIALTIGIFCYQVAYGITMGPNGTMTVTNGNREYLYEALDYVAKGKSND